MDLNLLVALDVLVREQSVTRAGKHLGLSQPAMSNVLARLRDALHDPVLVRTSRGMMPTPRVQAMVGPVRRALSQLQAALRVENDFEPATARTTFTIAATDHMQLALLPRLMARLGVLAPGIGLEMRAWVGEPTLRDVEAGRCDLAISVGGVGPVPSGLHRRDLLTDSFVCMARRDHPRLGEHLDLDAFLAESHVLVSPRGGREGLVDSVLAQRGLHRRVALVVPHFLVAPLVVAQTDLIVTLSRHVASLFTQQLPLRVYPPPLQVDGGRWFAVWHERTHREPAHRWLRELLAELAEADAAPPPQSMPEGLDGTRMPPPG